MSLYLLFYANNNNNYYYYWHVTVLARTGSISEVLVFLPALLAGPFSPALINTAIQSQIKDRLAIRYYLLQTYVYLVYYVHYISGTLDFIHITCIIDSWCAYRYEYT